MRNTVRQMKRILEVDEISIQADCGISAMNMIMLIIFCERYTYREKENWIKM